MLLLTYNQNNTYVQSSKCISERVKINRLFGDMLLLYIHNTIVLKYLVLDLLWSGNSLNVYVVKLFFYFTFYILIASRIVPEQFTSMYFLS